MLKQRRAESLISSAYLGGHGRAHEQTTYVECLPVLQNQPGSNKYGKTGGEKGGKKENSALAHAARRGGRSIEMKRAALEQTYLGTYATTGDGMMRVRRSKHDRQEMARNNTKRVAGLFRRPVDVQMAA